MSAPALGRVLRGAARLNVNTLEAICAGLGLTIGEALSLGRPTLSRESADLAAAFEAGGWQGVRRLANERDGLGWARQAMTDHLARQVKTAQSLMTGVEPPWKPFSSLPELDSSVQALLNCLMAYHMPGVEVSFYRTYLQNRLQIGQVSVQQWIAAVLLRSMSQLKDPPDTSDEILALLEEMLGKPFEVVDPLLGREAAELIVGRANAIEDAVERFVRARPNHVWLAEPMLIGVSLGDRDE